MMKVKTSQLEHQLKRASKEELHLIANTIHETTFANELMRLCQNKNFSKSELIKNTTLDRNYAYQIMGGTKEGSQDKVIQMCLALSCTLEETNRLLTLSNNPTLYAKKKRDSVLIYAIENTLSVMDTNDLLLEHNHETL